MSNFYSIAEEFVKKTDVGLETNTVANKIRNYVSGCLEAFGVSLTDFKEVQAVNEYEINEELETHILKELEKGLVTSVDKQGYSNLSVSVTNKTRFRNDVENFNYDDDSTLEEAIFVMRQFLKNNFTDGVYRRLRDIINEKLNDLEEKRRDADERLNKLGVLNKELLFITFNRDIFDRVAMEEYFEEVWKCHKEYRIGNERSLSEEELVLLGFLGLRRKLTAYARLTKDDAIKMRCFVGK